MVDHTISEALAAVQAADAGTDSIVALVATLRAQVSAIPTLTSEQQTAINQIFDTATADAGKITTAVSEPPVHE